MEEEKRQSPREACDCKLFLIFQDREIQADLRNISTGGAYIQITGEECRKVSPLDIGRSVTFRMANGKSHVDYRGIIGRYTESDEKNKYVAVHFNQRNLHESL